MFTLTDMKIEAQYPEAIQYYSYSNSKKSSRYQREIVKYLLNYYLKKELSINKLRKLEKITITNQKTLQSHIITYDQLDKYLLVNHSFKYEDFGLYEIKCKWLDGDINIGLHQHAVAAKADGNGFDSLKMKLDMSLGEKFPLKPSLDREGVMYNSFQKTLSKKILSQHTYLVENSHDFVNEDWLYTLISMFSNCISVVDITLNQTYLKAEYDPLDGWKFCKEKLGVRHNRRITDKLKWIYQITGNQLDSIEKEMEAFNIIRVLRNHTQHFDPPCFGFSLEEAAQWLNKVRFIGGLLFKMRRALGSEINDNIIALMLLPDVKFSGNTLFDRERLPQEGGYESTTWE